MSGTSKQCIVPGCDKKVNDPCVSFFALPKDEARARKWFTVLKLPNQKYGVSSLVCQNHFSRSQFTSSQRCRLIKSAIPHLDEQPHKDLTTQITRTQRSSVPHLISSKNSIAEKAEHVLDLDKTLYVHLTRLKLPPSTNDKDKTLEHTRRSRPKQQSSSSSSSCIIKRCILCPNPTVAEMGQNNESCKEKWKNLRLILCRILNLQNKSFSDIPFCKDCENRVEEFEKIYMELKVLELRVEKEIEKFKSDLVNVYLKRKVNVFTRVNVNKSVVDAILTKWSPETCSKKAKPNLMPSQPQQANNTNTSTRQIIVLPVSFSVQNLNPGNPSTPSTSFVALNPGIPSTSPFALNPGISSGSTSTVAIHLGKPSSCSVPIIPGISSTSSTAINPGILSTSSTSINPGILSTSSTVINTGTGSFVAIQPGIHSRSSIALNSFSGKEVSNFSDVETQKIRKTTDRHVEHVAYSSLAQNSLKGNTKEVTRDDLEELSIKSESTKGGDGFREISDEEFEDGNSNNPSTAQSICDDVIDNSLAKPKSQITSAGYVRKVRLLRCPICPAILKRTLRDHLAMHNAEARFECYDCDEKFNKKLKLSNHRRLVHGYSAYNIHNLCYDKSRIYNCKFCLKPAMLKHEFLRHINRVHLDKDATDGESFWFYECDVQGCKNCFSNQSVLKNHMLREHQKDQISECEVCAKIFCVKDNMEIHRTGHSVEPQTFPCSYCYRVFDSELELNKHLPRHQILFQLSKFNVCERCGKTFLNRSNWYRHKTKFCIPILESKNKFPKRSQSRLGVKSACKICGKEYGRTAMRRHGYLHTHPEGFKCSHCTHVATSPEKLIIHNMRCHLNRPAKSKRLSEIKLRWYKCEHCTIDPFRSQSRFLRHIKNVHLNNDIVDGTPFWFYYCDFEDCKVSCSSHSGLKDHVVKSHELQLSELHECENCARFFCVKENLERHKKCHSDDETVLSCNYCSNVFTSDADLEKHTQNHLVKFQLSQFVHTCELCGEGFLEMSSLYAHKSLNKRTGRDCRNLKYNSAKTRNKKATLKNSVPKPIKRRKPEKRNRKPMTYKKSPCVVCGTQFILANLKNHMYKHSHPEGFKCAYCGHISLNPSLLKMHEINVHNKHSECKSIYTCEYCQKLSPTRKCLKIHQIRYHPQEFLQGRIPCIACHDIFDSAQLMDSHFQDKHPDKICLMEGCGKKFADTRAVTKHKRTHTGEKPFVCSYCNASFGDETIMQYHINTRHTFHRSFLCKLCPDNPGFYERRTFYKHVSTDHPEKNPTDILQHNYLKRKFVANYHADYVKKRLTH